MFKPSPYQAAIFDWITNGSGNAVVEAVAGSGKTTTAVRAMELIPPTKSICFLAFNKSIADELKTKAPRHADVMTLNGLGHRAWMRHAGKLTLTTDKTRKIVEGALAEFERKRFGAAVRRMVGVAKSAGLVPNGVRGARGLLADTVDNWQQLIARFDIDLGRDATEHDELNAIDLARRVLILSCDQRNIIDFDDQLYLSVAFGARPSQYDWIFVDEAQDLSPIQHRLVESAAAPGGRVVAIGDSRQAIYGFRGADSESMSNFATRMNATRLDLSICYRCPKSHLERAQEIVPQIRAADDAPEGEIIELEDKWQAKSFTNEDLIICRNSAPLVRVAYTLLSQRMAVRILGRDLGAGLVQLIRSLGARTQEHLREQLDKWRDKEVKRLQRRDPEADVAKIEDKYETISTFLDMFPRSSPEQVCREIENLYTDNAKGILTLATVHKAKGLEANRVFILNYDLMPSRHAKQEWQKEQEKNLEYVALTRARSVLGFMDVPKK